MLNGIFQGSLYIRFMAVNSLNSLGMKKKSVALIVDNPLRDLDGMSFLSWKFASEGYNTYLVPMYQYHEVYVLKPDLVILNYIRKSNLRFVERCRELGITLVVLDTEGGVLQNLETYFSDIAPLTPLVDLYALWGQKQKESLGRFEEVDDKKLVVTGHPRFDLYHPKFNHLLGSTEFSGQDMVLINTNFSFSYPKFQSREQEINDLIQIWGKPRSLLDKWVNQQEEVLSEMIKTIDVLSKQFPEVKFVIRPHPFEASDLYEEKFNDHPNVFMKQKGSVLPWIRDSLLTIHNNCSTAIESAMLGRTPVHINWPHAPDLIQPLTQEVSHLANSIEEVGELIQQRKAQKAGESNFVDYDVFTNYFSGVDGKSVDRFFDAVEPLLEERSPDPKKGPVTIFKNALKEKQYREFTRLLLIFTLGFNKFRKVVDFFRGRNQGAAKRFNEDQVRPVLTGLKEVNLKRTSVIECDKQLKLGFPYQVSVTGTIRVANQSPRV